MEILNQLDPLLRTFWYIAIPTSLVFLTQTLMTFVGASHGSDTDFESHDPNGDSNSFHFFSFRNLINFLLGFGWSGISLYHTIHHSYLLIFLSLLTGIGFVWLFFFLIQQLQRLTEDNSFRLTDALHKEAQVYLNIPGNMQGTGKIHISIKGSHHELDAMTHGDSIPYGIRVEITAIENNALIVYPIKDNQP
jgi:hypothetical protein